MSKIKLVFFSMLMVIPAMMFAQTPLGINYQGIARAGDGSPLINQNIGLRVSITAGPDGSTDYIEEHHVITNDFGLFTVIVGEGQSGGSLNDVDWVAGNKWLQVEVDAQDQGNYTLVGTQQLVSVPYALFAAQSGNDLSPGVGIDISNGKVNNVLPDQVINLEGEGATTVSGTYPSFRINSTDNVEDADASPTNEIQTITLNGNNLELSDGGVVDLSGFVNTDGQNLADVLAQGADANGAIITGLADPLAAQDAATKNYVDSQNDLDLDRDSTNEIQDLQLATHTLSITNNGSATPIDLVPYLDNKDEQNLTNVLVQGPSAGGSKIEDLANPTAPQDAATKDYVDTQIALDGDTDASNEIQTLSDVLGQGNNAGNVKIANLATPTAVQDAATKGYVDGQSTILSTNISTNTTALNTETTARTTADGALQGELDATQTGAGLNANGSYTPPSSSNFLGAAVSLNDADSKLDDEISINASSITTLTTRLDNTYAFSADFSTDATAATTKSPVNLVESIDNFKQISSNEVVIGATGLYLIVIDAERPNFDPNFNSLYLRINTNDSNLPVFVNGLNLGRTVVRYLNSGDTIQVLFTSVGSISVPFTGTIGGYKISD
jgi:hypothetical protein